MKTTISSITEDLLFLKEAYNWDKLAENFDWVRAMKDCPQDPVFHAEGDVFIHTRMVLEELFKLRDYQKLNQVQYLDDLLKVQC